MTPIDGKPIAASIRREVAAAAQALRRAGSPPTLAIVVPTLDDAAAWYTASLQRAAAAAGIEVRRVELEEPSEPELAAALAELSSDPAVDAIVCQTPLPGGVRLARVAEHIAVAKDVDGANPASFGRLAAGERTFPPATAHAVVEILRAHQVPLRGAEAVIVGRSLVVGKPLAMLLLAEDATVTVCHTKTKDLAAVSRRADVLVAAAGRPRLIGPTHVRHGAVVVDVGTNAGPGGTIVGDVDADAVAGIAGAITPVPGGVGPVTTALLLRNVVQAARRAAAYA